MKHNEFNDLAAQMEAACGDWENSDGLSKEALSELIAKVDAMDAKEHETKPEELVVKNHFRLRKRYIFVLAAALVLVMGTGVVGDRVWISDSRDMERESEITTKVNNEDKQSVPYQEDEVYQEISDKLGIVPMWLGYKPEGMVLDSYSVAEGTGWAYVNYVYDNKIISVQMTKRAEESSSSVQWDGEYRKIENVTNAHGYEDIIEAYCVDEKNYNYGVNLTYGNGYYNMAGFFGSEEQFLKILHGIYFKNL